MIKKTKVIEEEGQKKKSARPESFTRQRRFEEEKETKKTARPDVLTGNAMEGTGSKKKAPVRARAFSAERIPMTAADLVPDEYETDESFDHIFNEEQDRPVTKEKAAQEEDSSRAASQKGLQRGSQKTPKGSGAGQGESPKGGPPKRTKKGSGAEKGAEEEEKASRDPLEKAKKPAGSKKGSQSAGESRRGAAASRRQSGGRGKSLEESERSFAGKGERQGGKGPLHRGGSNARGFLKAFHWKQPAFLRMPAIPGGTQEDTSRKVYLSIGGIGCVLGVLILGLTLRSRPEMAVSGSSLSKGGTAKYTAVKPKEGGSDGSGKTLVERDPVSFTVSCVGDCTLGTDEYFDWDSSLNNYYDMYGPDYFLEFVRDIFLADDLTIANMEGALTQEEEREDKTFAFKGEAEYCQILTGSGVDCANTANNHTHDYGEQGYLDTLEAMRSYGLTPFGYDEVCTIDVKGVKVGISGIYILDDPEGSVTLLRQNMQKLKDAGAEMIICIFHWGIELDEAPDKDQTTLGRLAIDLGADLVCGHHPHVLQGIEVYKGRNIVYSLGNFCFGGNTYPTEFETAIFQQTFTVTSEGVAKDNVTNVIPCLVSSTYDYNDYRPTPQTGEEAESILELIDYRSSLIEPALQSTIGG